MKNHKIKAVVLDVDGVLVGREGGQNFPNPGQKIINALKKINAGGIPVILCTGRPFYTPVMKAIINGAGLNNFHVGDLGTLIMNPCIDKILFVQDLGCDTALPLAKKLIDEKIYTSLYTPQNYIVQKDQAVSKIMPLMAKAVDTMPELVDSLGSVIAVSKPLYFIAITNQDAEKSKIAEVCSFFNNEIELQRGNNPTLVEFYLGNIVPAGVSKASSLKLLLDHLGIPFENVLGAGDGVVDWEFMKFCGFRGTLKNAMPEVLEKTAAGDKERNFIGGDVDQNGILDVFRHFGLLA
jgi:HAD superfamily hydrolase (TIGR01484 family)